MKVKAKIERNDDFPRSCNYQVRLWFNGVDSYYPVFALTKKQAEVIFKKIMGGDK